MQCKLRFCLQGPFKRLPSLVPSGVFLFCSSVTVRQPKTQFQGFFTLVTLGSPRESRGGEEGRSAVPFPGGVESATTGGSSPPCSSVTTASTTVPRPVALGRGAWAAATTAAGVATTLGAPKPRPGSSRTEGRLLRRRRRRRRPHRRARGGSAATATSTLVRPSAVSRETRTR